MNRSFVQTAAWAFAAALATGITLLPATPAQAASFTFNDANCASFSLSGGPSSYTLSCASLSCVITPVPSGNVLPNASITLNTVCTPAPTGTPTYAWSLTSGDVNHCPSVASQSGISTTALTATAVTSPACVYTLSVTGASNGGGTASATVSWTTAPPPPPTGCTITGLPSGNQTSPYSYSLGVTCATGTATSWAWSGGSNATTQAISGSITATTTFNVVASNAGGSAPSASGTITIGGGGNISCPGFNNTHVVVIPWGPPGSSQQVTTGGAWGSNDAYVIQFTTPGVTSPNIGNIAATEYQSGPFEMATKLSATACDFTNPGVSQSPTTYYEVTNTVGQNLLQPNTTYYWNMKHYQSGGGQAIIILTQPSGL